MVESDQDKLRRTVIEDTKNKMNYKFIPDSGEVEGDVGLRLKLCYNVDPNLTREGLEKLTQDITFTGYWPSSEELLCMTTPDIVKTIFDGEVRRYSGKEGKEGYTENGYQAIRPLNVPDGLHELIHTAELRTITGRMYPT